MLELLIALAIGALVVLGVHAAVGVAVEVASRHDERTVHLMRTEAARQTIRRWLQAAYLPPDLAASGFEGVERTLFGESVDELTFLTLDLTLIGSEAGSSAQVSLRVDPDSGLIAGYAIDGSGEAERIVRLMPEVQRMDVRYLVRLGDEARWFEAWSSRVRLPAAVEIRLSGAAADTSLSSAPLVVALPGNG